MKKIIEEILNAGIIAVLLFCVLALFFGVI